MTHDHRLTCRALAALLHYPDDDLLAALPEIAAAFDGSTGLPAARRAELRALVDLLQADDPIEAQARFVETFDRGRATSLHLFEHVHGDSRDRGPAMVSLGEMYEQAGLALTSDELPDHLTVVLEFASTQPRAVVRGFLGEMAHILTAIFSALRERRSPYACVIAAVLELAGQPVQAAAVEADAPIDEAWEEPPAFGGCSTRGQSAPDLPQPIRIVRSREALEPRASRDSAQGAAR